MNPTRMNSTTSPVNAALKARFDELVDEYDKVRANIGAAQRRMRGVSATARSSDATVTVTVDFRGGLTDLELSPRAYQRYSPSVLAAEIIRLLTEAKAQAAAEVGEIMAPFIPASLDPAALASGDADAAGFLTAAPLTNENFDQWRARFSGRSEPLAEDGPGGRGVR